MAFSTEKNAVFGDAIMGGIYDAIDGGDKQNSVLLDPNGLTNVHKRLDSSWWGNIAAGVISFGGYSLIDPTRGLGKVTRASRAANYVTDPAHADRLATIANSTLDAGGDLTSKGNVANTVRTLAGGQLDETSQAGRMFSAERLTDNNVDINSVMNHLDPLYGTGAHAASLADAGVGEMFVDAGKIADIGIQRQVKLNIRLAMTGGGDSMKWLVDNVPAIAAKGKRLTSAPPEYALYRALEEDVAANGLTNFDFAGHLERHYGTEANLAEIKTYAQSVADVRKFKTSIEHGADGQAVDFGTSKLGVQVAPRTLELLKTALTEKILDSHLLQDGASGRTIRVVNGAVTPHAVGSINIQDPQLGNRQLMDTMRTFNAKIKERPGADGIAPDVFPPEVIRSWSERWLGATQLERGTPGGIAEQFSDLLINKIAEKFSPASFMHSGEVMTPTAVRQMVAEANSMIGNARAYGRKRVDAAKANGEADTWFGEAGGSDTVYPTASLSTHLDNNVFLWDWRHANEVVDKWYVNNGTMKTTLSKVDQLASSKTAAKVAWALGIWRHGVLLRPGLAPRAIADTGLRTGMILGAQSTYLQIMAGALNSARNVGNGLLKTEDRMSMTANDHANAQRQGALIDTLRDEGNAQTAQYMDKIGQATDVGAMAESFGYKVHHMPTPRPANPQKGWVEGQGVTFDPMGQGRVSKSGQYHHLSRYYENAEQRAIDLEQRMRGTLTPTGGGKPLGVGRLKGDTRIYEQQPTGLRALNEKYAVDTTAREQSIKGAETAKARYEQGSPSSKLRGVSTPFMVDANGKEIGLLRRKMGVKGTTWQAVKGEADYQTMVADATAGGTAASIYGVASRELAPQQVRADLQHGSTFVKPDDAFWPQKMVMVAAELRGSYVGRRMINERETVLVGKGRARTPQAVEDSFLNDPKVEAEARAMMPGQKLTRDDTRQYLNSVANTVQSMTVNPAAHAMLTGAKDVTVEMANSIRAADRFHIYGPDIHYSPGHDYIGKAYDVLLNMPDIALARVPLYNGLYHQNVGQLVASYTKRAEGEGRAGLTTKERVEIHSRARQRSLNDVRLNMYDTQRTVGSHGTMALISPFFAPWEDAMMSWGRILYDHPEVAGRLMRISQTPDMFHITTTQDGGPVLPFDGTPMQDKYINLFGQRFSLGSFNSIQQGNVPFSPGVGPTVQVPATVLLADILPKLGAPGAAVWDFIAEHPDNLLSKTVLPQGGVPKGDAQSLALSLLPSWGRKAIDAMASSDDHSFGSIYPTAFGTKYNDLIIQYRTENGGRDPSADELKVMREQASSGARAAGMASVAGTFLFGISGNAAPQGQMYVDKMHALNAMAPALAAQGLTAGGVFATMYPNASNLNWSFSVNEGRLEATVNSTSAYYTNKKLMDANKEAGWWVAGPDNLLANLGDPDSAGKTFSQSAYNQQMNAGLRRRYSVNELVAQQDIAMGYGRMAAFDSKMNLFMADNGIKNLNSKNSGNLGVLKTQFVTELRDQFPEWAKDQDKMDRGGRKRQIEQIQRMVENPPPSLRNRPDVITTAKYLFARQALIEAAQEQNKPWTGKDFLADRYSLWQLGGSLAKGDLVFQQAWSRLFESEFKNDLTPSVGS
jgi:hypothetical protein